MNKNIDLFAIRELVLKATQSYQTMVIEGQATEAEWMKFYLLQEDPHMEMQEVETQVKENLPVLQELANLNKEREELKAKGVSREQWLYKHMEEAASRLGTECFTEYIMGIDEALDRANQEMQSTIMTQAGKISQNPNLDGFIAEQEFVNSYNVQAALENSDFRARVLQPKPGEGYGKNSTDIVVDNVRLGKKNVQRIQVKMGKNADASTRMIKEKNYNNQRILVPENQVKDVKDKLLSHKTVSNKIRTTDGVESRSISKKQVKTMQNHVQKGKRLPKKDWSIYKNKALAIHLSKQVMCASAGSAALGATADVITQLFKGESIEVDKVMETAVKTGVDSGAKASVLAALTVAVRKNYIPFLGKTTPPGTLAIVAYTVIEEVKVLYQLSMGKIRPSQALDKMGDVLLAGIVGTWGTTIGSAWGHQLGKGLGKLIGGVIGSIIPGVGSVVGGIIGSIVGASTGQGIWKAVNSLARGACNCISSVAGGAISVVGKIGSKIASFFGF